MHKKIFLLLLISSISFPASVHAFSLQVPQEILSLLFVQSVEVKGEEVEQGEPTQQPEGDNPEINQPLEDKTRELEDLKRGTQQMYYQLRDLESTFNRLERDKISIPQEMRDKLLRAKGFLEIAQSSSSTEEFQNSGAQELPELFRELEDFRRNDAEGQMRMRDTLRMLRGPEEGIKNFERQLTQLERKKIALPENTKESLKKMKALIRAIKAAQTWEEIEEAGIEEIQELMQILEEKRQEIEFLSRWPQTLKDVDRELKRLTQELKKSKTVVERLKKKNIDLSGLFGEFETRVKELQSTRDEAVQMVKNGESEAAISLISDEFFGNMEDVWESHRIIMTMSNLSRFSADFKKSLSEATREIKTLKKKKVQTSELEEVLAEAKAQGEAVQNLMKQKTLDIEMILDSLETLENLREEFEERKSQLLGEDEGLPWEESEPLFKGDFQIPSQNTDSPKP